MPDSSDIENGVMSLLAADSTLMTLLPDGIYFDDGPGGATRFGVVSLISETDEGVFHARAFEDLSLAVKAVVRADSGGNVKAAAARIDALLEDATITATGFSSMAVYREGRIRYTEVDESEESIRWFHRGGQYRVVMSR